MALDIEHLKQWIGKTESRSDIAAATPVQALAATLDRDDPAPQPGDRCRPVALAVLPAACTGNRRSARTGIRSAAASCRRCRCRAACGPAAGSSSCVRCASASAIARVSRIVDVEHKEGRSGALVFVRVRHEIGDDAGLALVEEHDIVYRDKPQPGDPAPPPQAAPADAAWARDDRPDPVLLFRYSALTFNGHRIHYDRRYVTEVEAIRAWSCTGR